MQNLRIKRNVNRNDETMHDYLLSMIQKISAYKKYFGPFFIIYAILMFHGCSESSHEQIPQASFYYWKSSFKLSTEENTLLDTLHVRRLYVKFFDVDWNPISRTPQPLAVIQFLSSIPDSVNIVPTVFLTNRTLEHLLSNDIDQLTHKITKKVISLIPASHRKTVNEIQMDCDWTNSTKAKYFRLLSVMSDSLRNSGIDMSATIRLHQYADPKSTGVPPVNKGVLMFYNMGEMEGPEAKNSILDVPVGEQYLNLAHSYPIHLDIVLPLFRWGVLIRRGRVVNLLHNVQSEELQDTTFFQNIDENQFYVRKSHYVNGEYVYANDCIRLESVSMDNLFNAMRVLRRHFQDNNPSIIFYHLEPTLEARYGIANIHSLLRSFSDR